ncbi:MAG: 3-phosphoshikimate 1-carboxyvinyltransferase [Gemmatimonadales bacterium]
MRVTGESIVPGDKSITHRALLLAGLIPSTSRLRRPLTSLDAAATARFVRAVGGRVSPLRGGAVVSVSGPERWRSPGATIRCGNSGTTARLGLGLLAGHPVTATLTGDRSLRRRPMQRLIAPLAAMGARFAPPDTDRLPVTIEGGPLRSIRWELPVSSAQLKSAVLLAGLVGGVPVAVREPHGLSRDHTERFLRLLGQRVASEEGWITFEPGAPLAAFELTIPGDPSSAAFLVGAALLAESGELVLRDVGLNPTRTAFLSVVERMGGSLRAELRSDGPGEPIGDLVVRPSTLRGTVVGGSEIPGLIDEVPLLAVLAARSEGETRFDQVGELRVKESDRLALIAENLRALGYRAETGENQLFVVGNDRPPVGRVRTEGDHRLAMAFGVLGTVPGARVEIDDRACAEVSFPGFFETLERIGR